LVFRGWKTRISKYVYNYRDGRNINKIASDHDSKLSGDMGGYRAWSLYLAENGPVGFYERYHVVYAPAYMYLLWITGIIAKAFSVNASTHAFLIKLWAVASELVGAYLIYKLAKSTKKKGLDLFWEWFYALNPGVSSIHRFGDNLIRYRQRCL